MSDVSNLGGLLYTTTNTAAKVVLAQFPCEFVIIQNDADSAGAPQESVDA